jgi:hypothetical protein
LCIDQLLEAAVDGNARQSVEIGAMFDLDRAVPRGDSRGKAYIGGNLRLALPRRLSPQWLFLR